MDGNRKWRGNLAWAGLSLTTAVLVAGLIAAPLTVVCIPADGRVMIELLGQDPCRHPGMHPAAARHRAPAAFGESGPADPCHDLILDKPGLTQCGASPHVPPQPGRDSLCVIPMDAGCILPLCKSSVLFKLAREPEPEASDSRMVVSLRI